MQQNVGSETSYGRELIHFLTVKNWFVRKLHGGMYQRGLPDLLVGRPRDGKLLLIEIKVLKRDKPYRAIDLMQALNGPQIGVILMLAKIRAPVLIAAYGPLGWLIAHPPFNQAGILAPLTLEELYEELDKNG